MVAKNISLRVHDPEPSHVGRNIVTLDRQSKEALGVTSGDIIVLEGTRVTASIIWPARQEDEGKGIIRMDSLTRRNAGVGLGEKVIVKKAEPIEAKKIILAPTQDVRIVASGYDRVLKRNFIGRPLTKGDSVWVSVFGSGFVYKVVDTSPRGIIKVTDFTQFVLREKPVKEALEGVPRIAYEDIGGLNDEVRKVREMIELPMKRPELFRKLGISPPKGVLLYGPPGTGKTLLAKAVANETQAHFISINAPSLMSKFVGEAEERIRQVFKEAEENAPSIIFFDEIDAIAPKRDEVVGEVERRVVAQLLASMDGMEARGNVIVIAATNRVNSIDEALRRPGRFDREIEIGVPDRKGRKEVLQIHTRGMPLKDVDLDQFAGITHGFVGADLAALAKESAMKALRKYLPKIINLQEDEPIPAEILESMVVDRNDFNNALKDVQPSALREVTIEVPNVKWEDVGGLKKMKEELKQAVEWPLKYPDSFKKMGITPPRGVLLYGPPGTGKTMLAKAVATGSEANFISVKGPELISMWVGESLPYDEKLLVFNGKQIRREKIGDIVENKKNLQVVTFDLDGKVVFSNITGHIKHPLTGKMLEVTTKTGRKIRVTDKHSLFSLVGESVESVSAGSLVPGESVLAVPSRIPNISTAPKTINLFEFFRGREGFVLRNVVRHIREAISKLGREEAVNILAVSPKYLSDILYRNLSVSVVSFSKLMGKAGIQPDFSGVSIGKKGARSTVPVELDLTPELFRLMGLWVAEGDFNQGVVRLHAYNDEIRQDVREIAFGLGINCSLFETSVVINSTILKEIFENVFGLKEGAFNKTAPSRLYTSSREQLANFLKGYFSGDGSIHGNSRRYVIEASTVSEELANDLMYLLLKAGIVASAGIKKEWSGSISHRLTILGVENFRRFSEIGFIDAKRNSLIGKYVRDKKWERSNLIPMSQKIKALLEDAFIHYPNNASVGTKKIREALQIVDAQRTAYGDLWKLTEMDIFWDRVKSVKQVDYSGFVYDISVEPCENFVAGFGGIFAHNSEKGIRKVFHRARQVSPAIVFFDEIDSIATRRGASSDSHVNERVVNQLLTELDGIETLKDVVFIAATNRPDLIDPGLIRPGRIDKLIKVTAPDLEARRAIFKVHTKKVPLADDVSLEELAKKTEGYSGADIEGVVREAALILLQAHKMKAEKIPMKDFEAALKKIQPSLPKEINESYENFKKEHIESFKPSYVG